MLAGRNDSALLDRFVRDFGNRFGDENGILHGAYGYRWRKWFDIDQLERVIFILKDNPLDRRVVIQMWDAEADLGNVSNRDIPCNTHIYPRIVDRKLDIMVCCRSNDVVWGATGANAVHFAFLLEYLAGRIGVGVGVMRQMTTNLHGYTDVLAKIGEPSEYQPYDAQNSQAIPIGTDWENWDKDLLDFLNFVETGKGDGKPYHNSWFAETATPMWFAHTYWRLGHSKEVYMGYAGDIAARDWRLAAQQWLGRRSKK